MKKIQLDSIEVGERLREDLGDLGELMASIQSADRSPRNFTSTCFFPSRLQDSSRRWPAISRRSSSMTIGWSNPYCELEENVRRKDLTEYERSKKTKELVEVGAKPTNDFSPTVGKKSGGRGRPKKVVTQEAIAEKVGIPRQTISRAKDHVAAGEKYPFLQDRRWSQKAAIDMAKLLDDIGEKDVEYLFQFCTNGHGGAPKQIRSFFETWKAAKATLKRKLRKRLNGNREERSRTVSLMAKCAPRPDPALVWAYGARRELNSMIRKRSKNDGLLPAMRSCLEALDKFHGKADAHNKKCISELRKELLS